jgi:hypothetical protein
MCKEMLVTFVNRVVDPKRTIGIKWRAKEEETHKGLLTKKIRIFFSQVFAFADEEMALQPEDRDGQGELRHAHERQSCKTFQSML